MDPAQQVDAGHYRAQALRIRREAATVKDAAIRSQLLEIATTYERIAATHEQLEGGSLKSNKLMRLTIGQ